MDKNIDEILDDVDNIWLFDGSQKVFDFVGGYVACKLSKKFQGCSEHLLVGSKNAKAREYIILLLKCCLKISSNQISHYVSQGFRYIRLDHRNNF